MTTELKKQVANYYEVSAEVLFSWLICLNYVRNLCAHHNRLWNRSLADSPKIPRAKPKYDIWHNPIEVTSPESNARIFQALTVIRYLSRKIECNEDFVFNLNALLEKYPSIPLSQMGFPENWLECPIWLE